MSEQGSASAASTGVTRPTGADVAAFLAAVPGAVRRRDGERLAVLMTAVTGQPAVMWGPSIVGFGSYHYRYASGREGDAPAAGFSPRKAASTVYFADGFGSHGARLARLGPHTVGTACLYLKDLSTIDMEVLTEMIAASFATLSAGDYGARAAQSPDHTHPV